MYLFLSCSAPVGELDVWRDCGISQTSSDCVLTWKVGKIRLPQSLFSDWNIEPDSPLASLLSIPSRSFLYLRLAVSFWDTKSDCPTITAPQCWWICPQLSQGAGWCVMRRNATSITLWRMFHQSVYLPTTRMVPQCLLISLCQYQVSIAQTVVVSKRMESFCFRGNFQLFTKPFRAKSKKLQVVQWMSMSLTSSQSENAAVNLPHHVSSFGKLQILISAENYSSSQK